jgi:Flp pilus assembly pilin Flp
MRRRAAGQSSTEYAVICAAIALALGLGMADSDSVLWQLVQAFRGAYQKVTHALSVPD